MRPEEIFKLIEERKRRAHSIGVDDLVRDLFLERHLISYDTRKPRHPLSTCSLISKAEPPNSRSNVLTIKGVEFVVKEEDGTTFWGEGTPYTRLALSVSGTDVFDAFCYYEPEEWGRAYTSISVDGFIEGPWINILRQLQVEMNVKAKESKQDFDVQRAEQMRKKFGI